MQLIQLIFEELLCILLYLLNTKNYIGYLICYQLGCCVLGEKQVDFMYGYYVWFCPLGNKY